ncbi:MAG: T9SS type A sorting domain-containing protein [Bacteroidales bacterium]|nr:T9SS type A sorting domain-containing protein [Bacteroidales bacterium]
MKTRPTRPIIAAITAFALLSSIFLLNRNQTEREKYEQFLLDQAIGIDIAPAGESEKEKGKSPDEPQMAAFQDFLQTVDPVEKRVPVERLHQAYFNLNNQNKEDRLKTMDPLQWDIIPSNMGGRTRCIMYDPNDASGNKVWAGAVTGGLWYNNDITGSQDWVPVDDFWPSLSISGITFDPNNPQVFYAGTGEAFTARVIYRESSGIGAGIFKSEDAGNTWTQLPATTGWKFVTDIEVRDENGLSVIYAGVASGEYHGTQQSEPTDGLFRSVDGGTTWIQVLPAVEGSENPYAVADIEITAGNRILIGTLPNLNQEGGATILYSDLGTAGSWTVYDDYVAIIQSYPDFPIPNRVMLASAPSDPDVAYALLDAGYINSSNGFIYTQGLFILRTGNGGATWVSKAIPTGGDYYWATIGWHALTAGVDPNNADALYIGGLDVYKSDDGANSWIQVSNWWYMYQGGGDRYVHADIHDIDYKPGSSDELVITTDGGVFYTDEAQSDGPAFQEKNNGYGSLQFYTCDIHSNPLQNKAVGGLQDNGTLYFTGSPLSIFNMIDGGDGACCFIDQNQPQYMITSVYYNQYSLWLNGNYYASMADWSSGTFISPADYDDASNILYANACSFGGSQANRILRIKGIPDNISGSYVNLNTGLNVYFSSVICSPYAPAGTSTLFAGSLSGRLFKATNAQATPTVTELTGAGFPLGAISCVAIGGSEDTLLVTFSNYGVSSVWQTCDGGATWAEKEANLPDMPVRWAIYHPLSSNYAMLATELGIWTTNNLQDDAPVWEQDIQGLANVRVDMLQMRMSDYNVLAATHGRGLARATWDIGVGVDEETGRPVDGENDLVEVWPNPTQGKFQITSTKIQTNSKIQTIIKQVEIVDLDGNIVISNNNRTIEQWNSEPIELNISNYPSGIYLVRIISGNKLIVKKIVKL